MTFTEYQNLCKRTAVYRETSKMWLPRMSYCAMGLASEAGEVLGQTKRVIRDDGEHFTESRNSKIADELGDVLYYAAMLAYECGLDFDDIARHNVEKLRSRFERGTIQGEGGER